MITPIEIRSQVPHTHIILLTLNRVLRPSLLIRIPGEPHHRDINVQYLKRIAERLVLPVRQILQSVFPSRNAILLISSLILSIHEHSEYLSQYEADCKGDDCRLEARVVAGGIVTVFISRGCQSGGGLVEIHAKRAREAMIHVMGARLTH